MFSERVQRKRERTSSQLSEIKTDFQGQALRCCAYECEELSQRSCQEECNLVSAVGLWPNVGGIGLHHMPHE